MNGQVWKFTLPQPDDRGRSWPVVPACELLSVGMQRDEIILWAFVPRPYEKDLDDELPEGPRRLIVANTGGDVDLPGGARFLGTATSSNGIVWHVWDGDAETTA